MEKRVVKSSWSTIKNGQRFEPHKDVGGTVFLYAAVGLLYNKIAWPFTFFSNVLV